MIKTCRQEVANFPTQWFEWCPLKTTWDEETLSINNDSDQNLSLKSRETTLEEGTLGANDDSDQNLP